MLVLYQCSYSFKRCSGKFQRETGIAPLNESSNVILSVFWALKKEISVLGYFGSSLQSKCSDDKEVYF
jgi:hypothetical protein